MSKTITQKDAVASWIKDAHNAQTTFLAALALSIDQYQQGNSNNLAKLFCIVQGKVAKRIAYKEAGKMPYAKPLLSVIRHVLPNLKGKYDAKADYGYTFANKKGANDLFVQDALDKLKALAEKNVSPFSKDFKDAFPSVVKEDTSAIDLAKAKAKAMRKFLEENNIALSVFVAMLEAKPTAVVEPVH